MVDPAGAVHLFGVRHHGPGSARSVRAALDEVRPTVVLVELPADATAALTWIGGPDGSAGLVPPVALLGWVVDEPMRAAFAPLDRFSPEWQAVVWAAECGVPVEAIDLPFSTSLAVTDEERSIPRDQVDPLAALAAAAGDPDAERWWEDVVEHRGGGTSTFAAVEEAMRAVRDGATPTASDMRREAHMRLRIRAAIRAGHDPIAVVCGAWHVPALDLTAGSASADRATLRGLPRARTAVSWVPWTSERLALGSGYTAGVTSPGWYDHVFHHPGPDGVARFLVDAARVLRAADHAVSPDHLIAATRTADSLASLRGRPRPGLNEVLDAIDAVTGGRSIVDRRLVVGDRIGSVPPEAPQVPLARDLAARQRAARLAPSTDVSVVELDLRSPNGLRRSRLLHQLRALGVPWGGLERGRGSTGTFRETWRLEWRPDWSIRIVELAALGTTVEEAATRRLLDRALDATGLAGTVAALDLALLAVLPEAVDPIVRSIEARAASDPDLVGSIEALGPLAEIRRYGDVRSTDARAVATVFDALVARILAGLVPACASLDDGAAAAMADRLGAVQRALALVDHPARRRAFPEVLVRLVEATAHGRVAGRATRLLHDGGTWPADEVERRLGRALSTGTPPAAGAAFVEGMLAGGGTLLVHDDALRSVVDRWLSSLSGASFDEVVPLLRRTFGSFDPAERRQIGRLLAGRDDAAPAVFGEGVDDIRAAAAMATVRRLMGLGT